MLPAACLESFSDDDDDDWWPCKLNCNWESGLLYVVAIPPSLPTRGPVDSSSNNNNNKSHAQTWTSSRSSSHSVLSRACVWPKNGTKVVASFCFWFNEKNGKKRKCGGICLDYYYYGRMKTGLATWNCLTLSPHPVWTTVTVHSQYLCEEQKRRVWKSIGYAK